MSVVAKLRSECKIPYHVHRMSCAHNGMMVPVHNLLLAPATLTLNSTLVPIVLVHRLQQAITSADNRISFSISELSNSRGFISTIRNHTT
jgi:hypothetical protein